MNRTSSYLLVIVSETIGGASLVLFAVFLFAGPIASLPLPLSPRAVLYWDAFLSLLFFAQHSVMVRRGFKDRLARRIGAEYHGAVYSIASGAALALTMLLWQRSPETVVALHGPAAWLLRTLAILAITGFVWGVRSLRTFDTFGRLPVMARLRGEALPPSRLTVRGAYRWMRHPLMFFIGVLLWTNPQVTADRLLFNGLWTAWLVIGVFFEERDLVAEFGDDYHAYQRVVPMLIPWRGPAGQRLTASRAAPLHGTDQPGPRAR